MKSRRNSRPPFSGIPSHIKVRFKRRSPLKHINISQLKMSTSQDQREICAFFIHLNCQMFLRNYHGSVSQGSTIRKMRDSASSQTSLNTRPTIGHTSSNYASVTNLITTFTSSYKILLKANASCKCDAPDMWFIHITYAQLTEPLVHFAQNTCH